MKKFGPGPPWPISGPTEPPIRAQTILIVRNLEKVTFYDWNLNNFLRAAKFGE